MLTYIIPPLSSPLHLHDFLKQQPGFSLTFRRKLKKSGTILINGQPPSMRQELFPGDQVTISWLMDSHVEPIAIPLAICYEDDHLLILDKPAGILTHPTGSEVKNTIGNGVLHYYRQNNLPYGFHPVHRLDRNTSGLLLVAKHPHIQHLLSTKQIKHIYREYQAIITGVPALSQGLIDAPIARYPESIITRMVHPTGQPAQTQYEIIQELTNSSLVKVTLLTGRTHQIRVHFSHIGHPLLGDDLYGGSRELIQRQALHSSKLSFEHPHSHKLLELTSPLPTDMAQVLDLLK